MSILAHIAAERPEEEALVDCRRAVTWRDLDRMLDRYSRATVSLDLGHERRVAVFAENAVECIIAHLAGIVSGASTVPINFHLTRDEVVHILRDSGTRVLFTGPENVDVACAAAESVGNVTVVAWRTQARTDVIAWESWHGDDDAADAAYVPRPHLLYTSGTTGLPKGVDTPPTLWPASATVEELVDKLAARYPDAETDRCLEVSPLYHTGGLLITRMVLLGTAVVILGRFDAIETLVAIDKYRPTTAMMVPTHFSRLLALPEETRSQYDVSSMRSIRLTGSACPVDVKRRMIEWFGPVIDEAYGATESGPTCTIGSAEWLCHEGSVGRAIAPYEVIVLDQDGRELKRNQVGHLYFRDRTGRGIEYLNDPDKTAAAHRAPGVFTLGDLGYVDDDDYVYITDRDSDMVVSGGVNLYPAETEQVLLKHAAVQDVACIGVPNDDMGEELKALVVATDQQDPPSAEELVKFCRANLAAYKRPRSIEFVTDLGRNSMGKLNKRALRAPYWPTERTIGGR